MNKIIIISDGVESGATPYYRKLLQIVKPSSFKFTVERKINIHSKIYIVTDDYYLECKDSLTSTEDAFFSEYIPTVNSFALHRLTKNSPFIFFVKIEDNKAWLCTHNQGTYSLSINSITESYPTAIKDYSQIYPRSYTTTTKTGDIIDEDVVGNYDFKGVRWGSNNTILYQDGNNSFPSKMYRSYNINKDGYFAVRYNTYISHFSEVIIQLNSDNFIHLFIYSIGGVVYIKSKYKTVQQISNFIEVKKQVVTSGAFYVYIISKVANIKTFLLYSTTENEYDGVSQGDTLPSCETEQVSLSELSLNSALIGDVFVNTKKLGYKTKNGNLDYDGAVMNVKRSGDTASRPNGQDIYIGFTFLDTTLGKPVYAKAISGNTVTWVDATGATV